MRYNNRMPLYKRKTFPKRKVQHTELKDGVVVFVEGLKPNPYKGVPCESLKIKSRIETGTFVDHEGLPHQAEKVTGADLMTEQIEREERAYEERKIQYENEKKRKDFNSRLKKAVEKYHPEVADLVD